MHCDVRNAIPHCAVCGIYLCREFQRSFLVWCKSCGIRCLCKSCFQHVVGIKFYLLNGLCSQPCTYLYIQILAQSYADGCRFHIHRRLFLIASFKRTLRCISSIRSHVFSEPCHGRTVLTIANDTRITIRSPCPSVDITPQRDTSHIVLLPHVRNLLFVALQLEVIVRCTNIVFCTIHRHLQCIVDFRHSRLEIVQRHVCEVV